MQCLIDSADPKEIRRACDLGIVAGVTTNPGLMGREGKGKTPRDALEAVLEAAGNRLVFCQVLGREPEVQIQEARRLRVLSDNIVVKVIIDEIGCRSIPRMVADGIPVAATTVNTIGRAILAANSGAHYVIPYYGWIEHTVDHPSNLPTDIMNVYRAQNYATKLLFFARDPWHVLQGAAAGAWGCTMETADLYKLFFHPQSEVAVRDHRQSWIDRFGEVSWLDAF